jgi:hypothetical protein
MILVESMYQSMKILTTKGKGGYTDSVEFNSNSKRAELLLWQYYFSIFEATRRVPEQMFPFLTSSNVALTGGAFLLPGDFGHFTTVDYNSVLNGDGCGAAPVTTGKMVRYLDKSELQDTLRSSVRGASLDKGRIFYTFAPGSKVQLYPTTLTGSAKIEYLRHPIYAFRNFTVNVTTDEQDYNPTGTTDYEWQAQEENNLIDLLLLFVGITIRDTPLIQWASSHQSMTPLVR